MSETPNPQNPQNIGDLAKAIVEAVRETNGPKKVSIAQLRRRSVFNPKGRSRKERRLDRVMYQNGGRLMVSRLHDEEISLLNQLQPGKFVDGLVEVRQKDNGDVHIFYNNKREHMLTLKSEVPNFLAMLKRCVGEAKQAKQAAA